MRSSPKFTFDEVLPDDIRPGDRVGAGFGIVTVRGIAIGGDRITLYWVEDQPAVTQSRFNTVSRVREAHNA